MKNLAKILGIAVMLLLSTLWSNAQDVKVTALGNALVNDPLKAVNIFLQNEREEALEVVVNVKIKTDNQLVLEYDTKTIEIASKNNGGSLWLNGQTSPNQLKPVEVKHNSLFGSSLGSNGLPVLSSGTHTICYQVLRADNLAPISNLACKTIGATSSIPPKLIIPWNESELTVNYPLFSWQAPQPIPIGEDINYRFVIVEIRDWQNAESALRSSAVFYSKMLKNTNTFQYPVTAPKFEECKKYAWRVEIVDEKSYIDGEIRKRGRTKAIDRSEVFVFEIFCNQELRTYVPVNNWWMLRPFIDDKYYTKVIQTGSPLSSENIFIKYEEKYSGISNLKYKVYDWQRTVLLDNVSDPVPIVKGENHLAVPLSSAFNLNEHYIIEVETPKGDIVKARFIIQED